MLEYNARKQTIGPFNRLAETTTKLGTLLWTWIQNFVHAAMSCRSLHLLFPNQPPIADVEAKE